MRTNEELISHLIHSGALHSASLVHAFKRCDRLLFVPQTLHSYAYIDRPLPIGMSQTISQPYTVAVMLELLNPMVGNRVLDIGSGSGWTTALLATAVGKAGSVEGIEIIPSLVEYGNSNLHKAHIDNASITLANPSALGREGQFYDRILVSASAPEMPTKLFEQLKTGGILVIPIQNSIWHITKHEDGTLNAYEHPGFIFVPLIV